MASKIEISFFSLIFSLPHAPYDAHTESSVRFAFGTATEGDGAVRDELKATALSRWLSQRRDARALSIRSHTTRDRDHDEGEDEDEDTATAKFLSLFTLGEESANCTNCSALPSLSLFLSCAFVCVGAVNFGGGG